MSKLSKYWELAEGFLIVLRSDYADKQTVEELAHMIHDASKKMTSGKVKTTLKKWLELVQKLKHQEAEDKGEEMKELDKILEGI